MDFCSLRNRVESDINLLLQPTLLECGVAAAYIVNHSDADLPASNYYAGLHFRQSHVQFRGEIGARWTGRGPCVLINDVLLSQLVSPASLQSAYVAAVVHEFGHALNSLRELVDDDDAPTFSRSVFQSLIAQDDDGERVALRARGD